LFPALIFLIGTHLSWGRAKVKIEFIYAEEKKSMKQSETEIRKHANRRSFLKNSLAASAATVGVGMLSNGLSALGADHDREITDGDAAILRFLAAAEILETDLWTQYNELGGVGAPVSGYQTGLTQLDGDMPQYIADNTDDEMSHELFINAYLKSKGAKTVDLDQFRTLEGSEVTVIPGIDGKKRLTNLMELTVDTSWWTRYRSTTQNPDFGDTFPNAVPTLAGGMFTAIPRNDAELMLGSATVPVDTHVQAIANTAGFHFAFIEQGGTSLYASIAQRVTNVEVLRIVLSIGGTEIMHFQTWHDKAGNAVKLTDGALVFPDLTNDIPQPESLQSNLIMPEPTIFLSKKFPVCSIIRPTATKGVAMGAVKALTADGLFRGQTPEFFEFLRDLAEEADEAQREV
jgi:Ferritin-like domain